QHQGEIFRWPKGEGKFHDPWRNEGECQSGYQARDEGADGGRRQRWSAAPGPGHLVALQCGDDGGAFAWRIEEDRRGRTAIHAAVIDAREHDEGAGRVELVGNG